MTFSTSSSQNNPTFIYEHEHNISLVGSDALNCFYDPVNCTCGTCLWPPHQVGVCMHAPNHYSIIPRTLIIPVI